LRTFSTPKRASSSAESHFTPRFSKGRALSRSSESARWVSSKNPLHMTAARFLMQAGDLSPFQPHTQAPSCLKSLSFWTVHSHPPTSPEVWDGRRFGSKNARDRTFSKCISLMVVEQHDQIKMAFASGAGSLASLRRPAGGSQCSSFRGIMLGRGE
jgi:hypothetical protein